MGIVKRRIPPFLIGIVIGTIFSVALLASWQKQRQAQGVRYPITPVHSILSSGVKWINLPQPIPTAALPGKIILLNFWTYSCGDCLRVLPELQNLEKEFGSDLWVLGIHSPKYDGEKELGGVLSAMDRYGVDHPVADDGDFKIWRTFGIRNWPTVVLINPAGHIVGNFDGYGSLEKLRAAILEVKAQFPLIKNSPRAAIPPTATTIFRQKNYLHYPTKLTSGEGLLWVAASGSNQIMGIDVASGKIRERIGSGVAGARDGDFQTAEFRQPQGIVYARGKIWVADTWNHAIREIDLKKKTVATLAGAGSRTFAFPADLALGDGGNSLIVAMSGTNQIWNYSFARKKFRVVAGNGKEYIDDGPYPLNSLARPSGISVLNNNIYFVDATGSSLRVLDRKGQVKTLVGSDPFAFGFVDGRRDRALMQFPTGLLATTQGIYIVDTLNHALRKFTPATGVLSTVIGRLNRGNTDGPVKDVAVNEPADIEQFGDMLYISDTNNHAIRIFDPNIGDVRTLELQK